MNLSPFSPTKTFQHDPFHIDSSHQILRRISFPLLEQSNSNHNRQGFHILYLRRCPSPGIQDHNRKLYELTPSKFRAVRMCACGNRQHFCTVGREKFSLASQCVSNVVWLLSSHNLHHKHRAGCALSPWTDTCSETMLNAYECRGLIVSLCGVRGE